jgi:RNA polymerase sigma-70 factor (ECF subfamily)
MSGGSEFARVYEDTVWRVYAFLAYRVGDRDLAEDLTQATFERALRAWGRFDPRKGTETTWLLVIARNVLIDDVRRRRVTPVGDLGEGVLGTEAGPEERLGGSPDLLAAVMTLPERDREVLSLRFGGDLTGAEIAETLGLSLANVQQILSRSLGKLRQMLDRQELLSGGG